MDTKLTSEKILRKKKLKKYFLGFKLKYNTCDREQISLNITFVIIFGKVCYILYN